MPYSGPASAYGVVGRTEAAYFRKINADGGINGLPRRTDAAVIYAAYTIAQALEHVLNACGDNLTRENVMKQAASIKDLELGGLLPGIKVNTSATNFAPLSQLQLARFKGETWERFGDIVSADVGE
jgi:branched-chain amino acid transport system substrate-binding protein